MFLIGIAGGSGSGKTTFAKKILQKTPYENVGILHQDCYYLPEPPKHLWVDGQGNFDHPEAFDWALFHKHLKRIKDGKSIEVPSYDYKVSRRTEQTVPMGPSRAVLVEGIFALWDQSVRKLLDLTVYLDVEADIRFIRRLHRDVKERGRTLDSVIRQYYDTVRPMYREFLAPTRQYADIIVGEENDHAADLAASKIREIVNSK